LYSIFMAHIPEARWDGSLESFFAILDEACRRGALPGRLDSAEPPGRETGPFQPELFAAPESPPVRAVSREAQDGDSDFPAPACVSRPFPDLRHSPSAVLLHELSAGAFDALVHAWMSELPIGVAMLRFAWNVIAAAREEARRSGSPDRETPLRRPVEPVKAAGTAGVSAVDGSGWAALPEARLGAERAAANRCDPDTRTVLEAAYKVRRETDRLMGLLRFSPCPRKGVSGGEIPATDIPGPAVPPGGSVYIARCSPDHHILPGLAEHFTRRFGAYPWAVIDEKRNLILAGEPGGETRLFSLGAGPSEPGEPCSPGGSRDYIEDLWRNYHRSINNPDRNNPALQQQFIPRRYRKYLPEFR
jgi:probable DNA metabolism protein